ncbi:hypothetical protein PanWU01x14_018580 [Parasponia andersonii]|uniref:Uncharacterized protein n=1 Tax=Parasponia andersonii TaxID=3476 RepID=A0A2P5DZA8_PARAD|nr:hypothetical protein PanWU01x14_018580 [Parasponia andersonii]
MHFNFIVDELLSVMEESQITLSNLPYFESDADREPSNRFEDKQPISLLMTSRRWWTYPTQHYYLSYAIHQPPLSMLMSHYYCLSTSESYNNYHPCTSLSKSSYQDLSSHI